MMLHIYDTPDRSSRFSFTPSIFHMQALPALYAIFYGRVNDGPLHWDGCRIDSTAQTLIR